jgi:hypothetical protein
MVAAPIGTNSLPPQTKTFRYHPVWLLLALGSAGAVTIKNANRAGG